MAAAVCPHPPLLVPQVATGQQVAARGPAQRAVRWLAERAPDLLVIVGAGAQTSRFPAGAVGSFAGFGVDMTVQLPSATHEGASMGFAGLPMATGQLPLSLSVGGWLLAQAGWSGPTLPLALADDLTPAAAAGLGNALARQPARIAILAMGDGSACRTEKAPGWLDPRAEAFDAAVTAALAAGDSAGLLAVDPRQARELLAAGRPAWQFLAGSFRDAAPVASVRYDDAPFGVQYTVATWETLGGRAGRPVEELSR